MTWYEFKHITSNAAIEAYRASSGVFASLLTEVKELSKKKPEASISPGKVKIINRVLKDLLTFLKEEPPGKYLELLDDETLPQMSDALLVMVQYAAALTSFEQRYHRHVRELGGRFWITKERVAEWVEQEAELHGDEEGEEDEDGENFG